MSRHPSAAVARGVAARGFTLLELVFVVILMAVLASIAYPSYVEQVRKSRRADAKSALLACAQMLERFHSQVGHYGASGDASVTAACIGPTRHGHYRLPAGNVPAAASSPTYSIEARPAGAQASDACGTFIYMHDGTHDVGGGTLHGRDCW